jgi:hypothetical protein
MERVEGPRNAASPSDAVVELDERDAQEALAN